MAGSDIVKYILKYGLFIGGVGISIYLYQNLLGAIPLLLLAFYFFYGAFTELSGNLVRQRHAKLEKGELP